MQIEPTQVLGQKGYIKKEDESMRKLSKEDIIRVQ